MLRGNGETFEEGGGPGEGPEVARGQGGEVAGEGGHPPGAALLEEEPPAGRGPHPLHAAVPGVREALDEPVGLEALDQPGDGGGADLLGLGQLAEGERAGEDDHRQRREPGRREARGGVLLTQAAQQVDGRGVEAVGDLERRRGRPGAGRRRGGVLTGPGHGCSFLSQAKYLRIAPARQARSRAGEETADQEEPVMSVAAVQPDSEDRFGLSEIGQIAVTVTDLDRATAFYRDALGIPYLFSAPPGMAFFDCAGVRLLLGEPELAGQERHASILYFRVADIHEAHRILAGRGVRFTAVPHAVHRADTYELWLAEFHDTEGNTHALMSEVR